MNRSDICIFEEEEAYKKLNNKLLFFIHGCRVLCGILCPQIRTYENKCDLKRRFKAR